MCRMKLTGIEKLVKQFGKSFFQKVLMYSESTLLMMMLKMQVNSYFFLCFILFYFLESCCKIYRFCMKTKDVQEQFGPFCSLPLFTCVLHRRGNRTGALLPQCWGMCGNICKISTEGRVQSVVWKHFSSACKKLSELGMDCLSINQWV